MRLWLKDSERRPDPPVVHTDDRKPMVVGIIAWVVALVVLVVFQQAVLDRGWGWWFATCAIGIMFGLIGLVYIHRRGRQVRR